MIAAMRRVGRPRFRGRTKKVWIPRLLGLAIVLFAALVGARQADTVGQLDNLLFDRYQQWQPRPYLDEIPVRVIDIDNESIARIGQWPWSRLTMARLNDRLARAGAGVVAYDIIFSESDRTSPANIAAVLSENPTGAFDTALLDGLEDHDAVFQRSLASTNSVLGFFLINSPSEAEPQTAHGFAFAGSDPTPSLIPYRGTLPALPNLSAAAAGEGFVSFTPEADGIVRSAPLFQRVGDRLFPSLSMEALRVVQGASSFVLSSSDAHGQSGDGADMASARIGEFSVKTDVRGRYRVYFADASREVRNKRLIPAWQILDDGVPVSDWADRVAGNLVFVGTSADGLKDLVSTPLAPAYEGVGVHAEIAEQVLGESLVGGQMLSRPFWAPVVENGLILLPGLLMIWLQPRLGAGLGAGLSLTMITGIMAFSAYQFSENLTLIAPVNPVLSIGLTYLVMTIVSYWLTERERSQIRGAFSRYLSPAMVSKVSDDPGLLTLGGEERPMTILFLDVRSFSKISEGMAPQEIVTFLNLFLTPMTEVLQRNGATIDKYIGDAIVAFWNAPLDDPDHVANACTAVLAMSQELRNLRARYDGQSEVKWPDNLSMGIGLNTGICCVGNLGSEQRFSYSMIGDAANLASRIEGLTKQYRTQVLIGSSTARDAGRFALLEADLIRVVGRAAPERIFILAGDEALAQSEDFQAHSHEHTAFLADYRDRDWEAALARIPTLKSMADPIGQTGYYEMMAERIARYQAEPPPQGWDGVFVATSK